MGFTNWFKQLVTENEPAQPDTTVKTAAPEVNRAPAELPKKPKATRKPKSKPAAEKPEEKQLTEKEKATAAGEPWVSVVGFELDLDNLGSGSFDLDWNEIFVARLVKAGYKGKTDIDIVDQWFNHICKNVLEENYEQEMADPEKRKNQ